VQNYELLIERAREVLADPYIQGADDIGEFESTDLWPGDFRPAYHTESVEGRYGSTQGVPVINYEAKPDGTVGLVSGDEWDWMTEPGSEQVAALLLLHASDGAAPSEQQIRDFAALIRDRAADTALFSLTRDEVNNWLDEHSAA
jgi:hypothetical protein